MVRSAIASCAWMVQIHRRTQGRRRNRAKISVPQVSERDLLIPGLSAESADLEDRGRLTMVIRSAPAKRGPKRALAS
jgi:hypothetical protein